MKSIRRSCLFIPANKPGMLQSADVFGSDAVIFDLEDAVAPSEKDSARTLLSHFLERFPLSLEVMVRINGLDTKYWEEDLKAILSDRIDTIMLPKARPQDLAKLGEILEKTESGKNLKKKIGIVPIAELAVSILEIEAIAAGNRVNGILLGAEDLTSDLEIERTKAGGEILYARSRILYACHAYKIDAIDTPFTDVNDNEGLRTDSANARSLGMTGKAAIHPNQIPIINEVFSPTEKQIAYALKVDAASKANRGVFSLDGKMVDKPIIERSEKVLEKAKKVGLL